LAKPEGVNGPPRSEAKTKGEADWRFSSRSARYSSPKRGCVADSPPLARRTCIVAVSNSIDDHCRAQSSDTRRPCRKPNQDHSGVALAMAVALGHLDQALDLVLGEVFAIAAHVPVAMPAQLDCP
jgi:hypothetical protein